MRLLHEMAEVPDETSKGTTYLGLRNVRKIISAEQDKRGEIIP